ncbi:hypothetical protein N5D52_25035 [Pseudomonas sp. GD03860]|uniref:hypothetical protein n=1 Tax=Pseudomonas TaxID=286 RepID=UPI00236460CC|nr:MULTISPECIES: hypothetical protein [Pseudomonas]MDD2056568.1 hypothetical protein [Pseudomonas putida]MDH0640198.1 hypothetical protein [Pseudomonas sp. GD03860]
MDCWSWDALSAIGTMAAVIVALWVSVQSIFANRSLNRDRAQLAAARMLSPLLALDRKAGFIGLRFGFRHLDEHDVDQSALKALEELQGICKSISIDDLYPLLPLPRHAAKRSAKALGLAEVFFDDAHSMLTHPYWAELDAEQRNLHYDRWMKMLSEIHDHLSVAVFEAESASSTGAPRPSRGKKGALKN